jgi:hypothetical protein
VRSFDSLCWMLFSVTLGVALVQNVQFLGSQCALNLENLRNLVVLH